MKIAFLVPDNRDEFRQYTLPEPVFGPAPDTLLAGLSQLCAEDPTCSVHVLSCSKKNSAVPQKIYNGNIFYHQLSVPSWGYLKTLYWGCSRKIRQALQSIKPDIVHGQGTERYCGLSAVRSGFANVITVHGNMRSVAQVNQARPFSFQWLAARLEGWTLPRSGGIVCLSNYTRQKVETLAKRTWVISNAVEERFFQVQHAPQALELACLGTICHHKNQNALIRALAPLQKEFPFTLHLYGGKDPSNPYTLEFDSLLAQHSWVKAHGHVSRSELPAIYARTSLVLTPSLEDNCPMVILEAMASGIPVIASRIGGIPDLVEPSLSGWLYESQNVGALQECIRQALTSPEKLKEMGEKSRNIARQKFSPRKIALRHLEVYREVLAASK